LLALLWIWPAVGGARGDTSHSQPIPPAQTYTMQDCQQRIKQWESWYAENGPVQAHLQADYNQLTEQNLLLESRLEALRSERNQTMITYMSLGAGFFAALVIWRLLTALRPFTPVTKQLVVFLMGAGWVSLAALLSGANAQLRIHPANWALAVALYSLPAILFCAIGLWWFAKERSERATHAP